MSDRSFRVHGHEYQVTLHPTRQGLPISLRLMGLGAGALTQVLAKALGDDGEGVDLEGVDWGAVGSDLAAFLADDGTPQLLRDVLAFTTRDGKSLGADVVFDEAFRGNYVEILQAAAEVCRINGFFPLPST